MPISREFVSTVKAVKGFYLAGILASAVILAACGSSSTTSTTTGVTGSPTRAPQLKTPAGEGTTDCTPANGEGVMGVCTKTGPPPTRGALGSATIFPDLSEWNGTCTAYSEAVIRIYEAGTDRKDARANCLASNLNAKHVWWGVYFFARNGNCNYEADRAVNFTRGLPARIVGPVIVDAETPMASGHANCLARRVESDGYKAGEYTSPGTWSGGPFVTRWRWLAAYPGPPGCISNSCPIAAHQFSENYLCRGIRGDCSVDKGILAARQKEPLTPAQRHALEVRRNELRHALNTATCRTLVTQHKAGGEPCKRWLAEGQAINAKLAADHLTPAEQQRLEGRRNVLRYVLAHATCRSLAAERHPLGEPCTRWFREGAEVNARLRRG
jgi:hypothetical protein